jgi:hypothetical protein
LELARRQNAELMEMLNSMRGGGQRR